MALRRRFGGPMLRSRLRGPVSARAVPGHAPPRQPPGNQTPGCPGPGAPDHQRRPAAPGRHRGLRLRRSPTPRASRRPTATWSSCSGVQTVRAQLGGRTGSLPSSVRCTRGAGRSHRCDGSPALTRKWYRRCQEARLHDHGTTTDRRGFIALENHLSQVDPVIGRLIERRPDFDPHAWLDELPPMDLFGSLLFQVAGQQLSVPATKTDRRARDVALWRSPALARGAVGGRTGSPASCGPFVAKGQHAPRSRRTALGRSPGR